MRSQLSDEPMEPRSQGAGAVRGAALSFALAGMLFMVTGCERPAPPSLPPLEVPVAQVVVRDQPIVKEMVGETRGSSDIPVRARVEGVLTGMHFREGSHVKQGDLLYEIDPEPFESEVVGAEGSLAEAVTRLAKAESDLGRIAPLAKINAVSQADLDGAIAQYKAAEGARQTARSKVEQAEIQLGYTRLHAPIAGRIGISKAQVGEFVGRMPNPVVLNFVSNSNPIRVRFSIDEQTYLLLAKRLTQASSPQNEQRRLATGLELVLADGSVHPEKGHAVAMAAAVDPSTGTLTLEAEFPNPEQRVLAGQFARVRVVAEVLNDAILIPSRAVKDLQGMHRVYVVDADGLVAVRPVELGPVVGKLRVVTKGLKPAERVAVEIMRLRPGMTIKPMPSQTSASSEPAAAAQPAAASGT
jgi:membrane fusion protein, multidrug efflux system